MVVTNHMANQIIGPGQMRSKKGYTREFKLEMLQVSMSMRGTVMTMPYGELLVYLKAKCATCLYNSRTEARQSI